MNLEDLKRLIQEKKPKNAPLVAGIGLSVEKKGKKKKPQPVEPPPVSIPPDWDWEWLKAQAKKPRIGSPWIEGRWAVMTEAEKQFLAFSPQEIPFLAFRCRKANDGSPCCPLCAALDKQVIYRHSEEQSLFLPPLHDFCPCIVVGTNIPPSTPFAFPPKALVDQWFGDRFLERVLKDGYVPALRMMQVGIERMKRALQDGFLRWDDEGGDIVACPPVRGEGIWQRFPIGLFPTPEEVKARKDWRWEDWERWFEQSYSPPTPTSLLGRWLKALLKSL